MATMAFSVRIKLKKRHFAIVYPKKNNDLCEVYIMHNIIRLNFYL